MTKPIINPLINSIPDSITPHFTLLKTSQTSKARAGILHTNHGDIRTPVFMPVGTQATVKALTPDMLHAMDVDVVLANTYHLALRPGIEVINAFKGLHSFMNWPKPILTDSGGFQVFSLSKLRKITDDGVTFQSHIDGSKHLFTPEKVVDLQLGFNSDILMPLDICSPHTHTWSQTKADMAITTQWAKQAKTHWESRHNGHHLFGIIQGGMFQDLRDQHVEEMAALDLPGYALGGLSVGESIEQMNPIIQETVCKLPANKPRYLMGVGLPENLEFAIHQGVDMFDCVIPTRLARHGQVFIDKQRKNIKRNEYQFDTSPIEAHCTCYTCQHYSKAYIRHLYIAKETLAATLMSIHNIHHLTQLVRAIRDKILNEAPLE